MKKNILIIVLIITNILALVFAYTQRLESQMHQQQAYEYMIKVQEVEQLVKEQTEEAKRQTKITRHETIRAMELADKLSKQTK